MSELLIQAITAAEAAAGSHVARFTDYGLDYDNAAYPILQRRLAEALAPILGHCSMADLLPYRHALHAHVAALYPYPADRENPRGQLIEGAPKEQHGGAMETLIKVDSYLCLALPANRSDMAAQADMVADLQAAGPEAIEELPASDWESLLLAVSATAKAFALGKPEARPLAPMGANFGSWLLATFPEPDADPEAIAAANRTLAAEAAEKQAAAEAERAAQEAEAKDPMLWLAKKYGYEPEQFRQMIREGQALKQVEAETLLPDFAEWERLTAEADAADESPEGDAKAEQLLQAAAAVADRILAATAYSYGGLLAQARVVIRELQAGGDAEQRLAETLRRSIASVTGAE